MGELSIKKSDSGFVVAYHATEQTATAEHVANFIIRFWPEVTAHLRTKLAAEPEPSRPNPNAK